MNESFDCIVIGAGPAGSTAATLVAEAGGKTLLLERETMPRFHVGESLMPETFWIFERLGVLDKMRRSTFVKKVSVQFVSSSGRESQPFFFKDHDPRDSSQTWQVLRSEFDQMLFENAADKGADCRDEVRVLDVLMDGARATGVKVQTADGATHEIEAKIVVDASGMQTVLAGKLDLKVPNPQLRKAAIWGYYEGARRDPGENGGATIILHTKTKQAWFWFIPLADEISSVGVVGDIDYLLKDRGTSEEVFEEELVNCPGVLSRLVEAHLVSKFRVVREFSYSTKQWAGDGWVLVGDALGFIDPIYSSGVYFALKSGEMAADAITEGLAAGDTSAAQLGKWSEEFSVGVNWVRKLVDAFYTDAFSFGGFMKRHPQHRGNLTDLLIGRIFHETAGSIFKDLDPWLEAAQGEQAKM
jgi:flavin-dependent dehydrogenase